MEIYRSNSIYLRRSPFCKLQPSIIALAAANHLSAIPFTTLGWLIVTFRVIIQTAACRCSRINYCSEQLQLTPLTDVTAFKIRSVDQSLLPFDSHDGPWLGPLTLRA
jgi:hypothetical protein